MKFNCKCKVIKSNIPLMEIGDVVEFKNNQLIYPNGGEGCFYNDIEDFEDRNEGNKLLPLIFTKSDLKAGMLVKNKDMGLCLTVQLKNGLGITNCKSCTNSISLDKFTDNLCYLPNEDYNIDKVWDIPNEIYFENGIIADTDNLEILYDRNQPRKVTKQEIRELLGEDFELID